jgi:serine/threonine-protein kinase
MLRLRTFGGLALTSQSRVPSGAASQRRPLALLAVLAVGGAHPVSRERLQHLLWPESDEVRARRVLAQTLYALRRDLGDPAVVLGTAELRLNPELVTSDVAEFEHALAAGAYERMVVLYAGPFLEGVHLTDAPEFDRWAEDERTRLAQGTHRALERLARTAAQDGDAEVAAGWWRRLAVLDPLDTRAAVGLMEALAASGDTAGALRHARMHEALFREELDAPADPAVSALAERLRTPPRSSAPISRDGASAPTTSVATPAEGSASARPHDVPPPVGHTGSWNGAGNGSGAAPALPALERPVPTAITVPDAGTDAVLATPTGGRAAFRRSGRWRLLALAAVVALLVGLFTVQRGGGEPALDAELVLVAPFDAADPALQVWREGLMDVLSRNLDGAGPLRTVSSTVVARQWTGRADREAVAVFARGLQAGTAIYGGLVPAGPDSVQAAVTLLDVRSGRPVLEISRREALTRMDRLSDSLTVALVRGLAQRVTLGAVQRVPLGGGTSAGALRPFLRGEQFLRRAAWDSAIAYYEQAVAADPAFALAHRRLGMVLGWQGLATDSLAEAHLLQAGALNRGLGPRDSLLVAADSQAAAANAAATAVEQWPFARRLFATLATAARAYPTDPEVWYEIGEARYHFGAGPVLGVGSSRREILDAFDRAIAADSAFGPAYAHTAQLALDLGGPTLALRYVNRYQAIAPVEAASSGARVLQALLEPPGITSPAVRQLIDTLSPGVLYSVRNSVRRWPDTAETAVRLARVLAWGGRASGRPLFRDSAFRARILAEQLAYRGHVREAHRVIGAMPVGITAELPYLGGAPVDSLAARLARLQADGSPVATQALGWWAARGDTAALRRHVDLARGRLADARVASAAQRLGAVYDTAAALAHLALAQRDSAEALRRFEALPDTLCPRCYPDRLTRARLLTARGRHRDAMADLREPLVALLSPFEILFALERGRVAERLGAWQEARESYALVVASWARGDPEVQPHVAAARAGLQRVRRR